MFCEKRLFDHSTPRDTSLRPIVHDQDQSSGSAEYQQFYRASGRELCEKEGGRNQVSNEYQGQGTLKQVGGLPHSNVGERDGGAVDYEQKPDGGVGISILPGRRRQRRERDQRVIDKFWWNHALARAEACSRRTAIKNVARPRPRDKTACRYSSEFGTTR